MFKMNSYTKQFVIWAIAAVIGATAGFVYWYYIGCNSGSCAITSSPVNSSIYGGVMAILLVNVFDKQKTKPENESRKETDQKA
jgi:xanthine/uracil permease